ncbi:hypothetical protein DFJ77DRAFT_467183 [Powellomyces hirtus]|nr:hypothetical protein DFJ77DRAFT_467183 [Powellomyces hirtus]
MIRIRIPRRSAARCRLMVGGTRAKCTTTPINRPPRLPLPTRPFAIPTSPFRRPVSTSTSSFSSSSSTTHKTGTSGSRRCWHCNEPLPRSAVFCSKGKIQPTFSESTYHDVLLPEIAAEDVPFAFDVDNRALRARFLSLQTKVHPDGFARASQTEKLCADQQSSFINKGYQTLRDPLARANYLLSLHGQRIEEHDNDADPELLMDVMEARESLEEATRESEVQKVKEQNDARLNETLNALSEAFRAKDLPAAKRLATQLRYWRNIKKAADEWAPGRRVELHH